MHYLETKSRCVNTSFIIEEKSFITWTPRVDHPIEDIDECVVLLSVEKSFLSLSQSTEAVVR
jgi:hypothetical protein